MFALIVTPEFIDFKNTSLLRKFISVQGKIFPKRINKVSFKNQRSLSLAV
jgi:ribosomal protein S18